MPPHKSRGIARQQRRICVPSPLWFCTCRECNEHPYYNAQTQEVKNGQYITEALFRLHSRRERQRQVATANYLAEAVLHPTLQPPAVSGVQKSASTVDQDQDSTSYESEETVSIPSRKVRRGKKLSRSPQVSTQLRELADSLAIINSDSFRDGFQRHPAVFVHPPQTSEIPSFELDPYAPSNNAFLQYERSLREASDFLRCCSGGPRKLARFDSLRLRRLQMQVSEEQERASRLKEDLWQHQKCIASQTTTKVIDTGLLFVCSGPINS